MQQIKDIWSEHVAQNPIENIVLEINLGTKIDSNVISYELTGSKFNEILADISLLKIWTDWKSGYSTKYFLSDMIMIVDESGQARVSINKTIFQQYFPLSDEVEQDAKRSGSSYLSDLPHITDIRIHKDDLKTQKGIVKATSAPAPASAGSSAASSSEASKASEAFEAILTPEIQQPERTHSNLHVKCSRKIPLSIVQFPPYDAYHAIEKIAFRYYRNANISVNFIISRPRDCLRTFDELLVNWQNSRFMIKIVMIKPCSELEAIVKYLGHN